MSYKYEEQILNVGDILYKINRNKIDGPIEVTVISAERMSAGHIVYRYDNSRDSFFSRAIGHSLFRTKEEAINELEKIKKCKNKRAILKEYENELNKKLGLENHTIIK